MRTADASPDLDLSPKGQIQAPPDRLYSGGVFRLLRRAFTPRGVGFFRFYIDLRKMALSGLIPEDIKRQYSHASKMLFRVRSPVDGKPLSPSAKNMLSDARPLLNTQFNRLLGGKVEDPVVWRKINEILTPLLVAVARDKEVFLKVQRRGRERWSIFHKMNGRQEKTERLRDDDPESFELMERYGKTIDEIDAAIQYRITRSGEKYKKGFVMGRPIHMGIDRETGEERVYDRDGDVLEFDDYAEKRKLQQTQTLMSARIATRTTVALKEVRSLSDAAVDSLSGDIHWTSLTDDKAKQGRLTRVLPTRLKPVVIAGQEGVIRVEKVPVIVSGRYKGVFLDDMVNSVGRMIEGTAYTYSPTRNRSVKVPKRIDPAQREPYVTAAKLVTEKKIGFKTYEIEEDKLYLKIPGTKQYKELRHAVKKLACNAGQKTGCIPSISYHAIPGTKAAGFYFSPKDFHVILDTIQSMSLSKGALKAVKTYYEDLSRAEEATAKKNLGHFSAENLGGFKKSLKQKDGTFKPFDFLVKQKQSIAWLEARGDSGVCALETGVGKCVKEDTLILTNKGLTPIRDINPGVTEPDTSVPVEGWSVLVGDKTLPIKSFYYGGPKPTIKVQTRRGFEIEGSLAHPLLVRTPDGQETWVKTPKLETGDFLCIERTEAEFSIEDPKLSVPVSEDFRQGTRNPDSTYMNTNVSIFDVPSQMTPELGRLLGYIVAEGWTNSRKGFSISQCPVKNPKVRADIDDLLLRLMGQRIQSQKDIQIPSVFLREYLLRMGVGMGVAKDKTVPEIILHSSKETVQQFIRGLIDAEGHVGGVGRNHIEFSTASEQLGRELQILLLRFGIMSSRRPKKVKGYDHTYWRLSISGQDAIDYGSKIGFVSKRKQAAVETVGVTRNSNLDVVPYLASEIGSLFSAILVAFGMNVSKFRREMRGGSASFDTTVNHVRLGRRNPTYSFLREMLSMAADAGCQNHPSFGTIVQIMDRRFFYDPIEVMEESDAVVMDIEVDDPSHCFVGNGVLNHNTMVAMGTMQKLIRDGLADDDATYETPDGRIIDTNGRFLFVCPTSLKGSLPKEIRTFMPDAKSMLSRVDIISYSEWARSCKSGRVPRSLRGVHYWRARRKQFGVIKQARRAPQVWESKVIWTPALYTALFFDEAHLLANPDSNSFKAANLVYHPRKILLTASPMKKNPKEAYLLASITNNIPLATHNPNDPKKALAVIDPRVVVDDVQKKLNRSEMRRFFDRFTETVGGRIVGVKQDPMVKHDMDVWVKQNIFHADKTNVEEFKLPELVSETMAIEMDPVVETLYRDTTQTFSRIMRGLVSKFRDHGRDPDTGHLLPEASDPNIERLFGQKFKPVVELLNNLANHPDDAMRDIAHMMDTGKMPKLDHEGEPIPVSPIFYKALHGWRSQFSSNLLRKHAEGVVNPKIEAAADRVTMKAIQTGSSSRTLLFSDDKKLCMKTGAQMSSQMPGWHGVALNDAIYIFEGGSQVHEIQYMMDPDLLAKLSEEQRDEVMFSTRGLTRIHVPFSHRAYRKHPDLPKDSKLNRHHKPNQWQQFVIREVIIPDANVKTMTLYGSTYQYGHNLQAFDTVIHLDRNHWDSENMKQRTARSWRQGQDQPVEEVTIDATFRASDEGLPREEFDRTLDEIRRYLQELQSDVFDRIIRDAQGIKLGEEWQEMTRRDSSNWRLDHKVLDLMLSPYVVRSQPPGVDR